MDRTKDDWNFYIELSKLVNGDDKIFMDTNNTYIELPLKTKNFLYIKKYDSSSLSRSFHFSESQISLYNLRSNKKWTSDLSKIKEVSDYNQAITSLNLQPIALLEYFQVNSNQQTNIANKAANATVKLEKNKLDAANIVKDNEDIDDAEYVDAQDIFAQSIKTEDVNISNNPKEKKITVAAEEPKEATTIKEIRQKYNKNIPLTDNEQARLDKANEKNERTKLMKELPTKIQTKQDEQQRRIKNLETSYAEAMNIAGEQFENLDNKIVAFDKRTENFLTGLDDIRLALEKTSKPTDIVKLKTNGNNLSVYALNLLTNGEVDENKILEVQNLKNEISDLIDNGANEGEIRTKVKELIRKSTKEYLKKHVGSAYSTKELIKKFKKIKVKK